MRVSSTNPRWAHLPECEAPPTGWSAIPFRSLATVIAGQSPPSESYNKKREGLPFLQGNGDFSDKNPIPSVWCNSPKMTAQEGDILISVRAPVGEVNRADRDYAIGRGLAAIRAKACDASFLYHALQRWRISLQRVGQGTTFDAVTAKHFAHLFVALPNDLAEQAAIARILDAVDTAIEHTREAVEQARVAKHALVQKVFSEGLYGEQQRKTIIGHIPKSWQVVSVNDVVKNFQYGLSVPMEGRGHMPILRMGNLQDGEVVFSDIKYVSLPETVIGPYVLNRGDVLFNRTNSQEWVGKVAIYRHDSPAVFASYLIRLQLDPTFIDPYYFGHVLGSHPAQCRIKRYATPGVQQVNVNATNLGKVLIPLPIGSDGLVEQQRIAALLEAANQRISSYEPILAAQQALKRSLMHDLLTGKVRVRDAPKAVTS